MEANRNIEEIARLLEPLVRPALLMEVERLPADAGFPPLLSSHFGGRPYSEADEDWPSCRDCDRPLDFVCQLDLRDAAEAFNGAKLIALYCCLGCKYCPPGWELRTYGNPSIDKAHQRLRPPTRPSKSTSPRPEGMRLHSGTEVTPCLVRLERKPSLPEWEGIGAWCKEASDLSCKVRLYDDPCAAYERAVEQVLGTTFKGYSYIGGYPKWIQGDDTPRCRICNGLMHQLLTIRSDKKTNLNWTDLGAIYLFHCPDHPEEKEIVEQFH